MRHRVPAWMRIAVVLVAVALVAACSPAGGGPDGGDSTTTAATGSESGDDTSADAADVPGRYDGPEIHAEPNLVGLKWSWDTLGTIVDDVAAVAGGSSFFEFEWCEAEPQPGTYEWTAVDDVVASTKRLGYTPMLKIRVGTCWVNGVADAQSRGTENKKTASKMPSDLDAYAKFVDTVVRRYTPMGVSKYAIENEVNAANFWDGTAEQYEILLRRGAQAVHAASASAQVFDGGISSIGYGVAICAEMVAAGRAQEAVAYYQAYYERRFVRKQFVFKPVANVAELQAVLDSRPAKRAVSFLNVTFKSAGLIDGYQLHYYEQPRHLDTVLDFVHRGVATTRPGIPIEAWEVGLAWPGDSFDMKVAAVETAKLFGIGFGAGIRTMVYLPAAYRPGGLRPEEIWRGLWEPDGSPRPAAGTFAQVASASSGDAVVTLPVSAKALRGVVFGHPGSSSTLLAWSTSDAEVALQVPGTVTAVRDSSGGDLDSSQPLRVGPDPVFVEAEVPPQVLAAAAGSSG